MKSIVYFFQRANRDIKIGTTTNLHIRQVILAKQHGELTLLGVVYGGRDLEQQLHTQFAQYRRGHTEFFTPHEDILGYIEKNKRPIPPPKKVAILQVELEIHERLKFVAETLDVTLNQALDICIRHLYPDIDKEMRQREEWGKKALERLFNEADQPNPSDQN